MDTITAQDIVNDHFGVELGEWLMENNLVIPVTDDKKPVKNTYPNFESYELNLMTFKGLAVIMNERLSVLDIDDPEWVIGSPNLLTTKGAHYWFTGGNFPKTVNGGGFDVKVSGYVVFWGKGKSFKHSTITTWDSLVNLFSDHSPLNELSRRNNGMNFKDEVLRRTKKKNYNGTYTQQVREAGIVVESESIMKGYCTQMTDTAEGLRNSRLFRLAIEAFRLGEDTDQLAEAAVKAGLDPQEVDNTIGSAEARFEMDAGVSVFDRVQVWRDQIDHATDLTEKQKIVVNHVFERAVATNSYKPQISQKGLAELTGINQGYIGTTLNVVLVKMGFLEKESRPGYFTTANGTKLRHCNNYYLAIGGVRLEDQLDIVDDLISLGDFHG